MAATMRRYLEQVACSLRPGSVSNADQALRAFAGFLHQSAPDVVTVAAVVRGHIEAYKPWLAAQVGRDGPRAANYPPGLHHALADERHRREVADRKASTRRELVDAGVRVIGKPKNFPWSSVEARVSELTNPDGELLTAATHGACPGHAAFIDGGGETVFVCQHPKDWNHGTPPGYQHRSKAEIQAVEEAVQARREQDEAAKVADEARASFLHDYLSRKGRPPAGTLRTALTILAAREMHYGSTRSEAGHLLNPDAADGTAGEVFVEAVAKTAENRLPLIAFATRPRPRRPICAAGRPRGSSTRSWRCSG
jgi:hypothetical protein